MKGRVHRVAGPVAIVEFSARMFDIVLVGEEKLLGEVIQINGNRCTVQVYEDTTGLKPGDPVVNTNQPLTAELGPGLLSSIYDGIQRPLPALQKQMGDFVKRGATAPGIDRQRRWAFKATAKKGDAVKGGDIIGEVMEGRIVHRIMIPPDAHGKIAEIREGSFTVEEPVCKLDTGRSIAMMQKWPVRKPRPTGRKLPPNVPLITGQRIFDALFPLAKGGVAAIPGGFGTGKCVTGDTRIFVNDRLVPIRKAFSENRSANSTGIKESPGETIIELRKPLKVRTFDGLRIKEGTATHLYRGKTSRLVRIRTRSGRTVKLTPAHKLLKLSSDLEIVETPSEKLKPGDYVLSPRALKAENSYSPIRAGFESRRGLTLPELLDESFAEFLGLFMARGAIKGRDGIFFSSEDASARSRFSTLAGNLFGLSAQENRKQKRQAVLVKSRLLAQLLSSMVYPSKKKHGSREVPEQLFTSPDSVIRDFLKAYINCNGRFANPELEVDAAGKSFRSGLCYLLLRLGILYRISDKSAEGRKQNGLRLSPGEALKIDPRFKGRYYFSPADVVPVTSAAFREIACNSGMLESERIRTVHGKLTRVAASQSIRSDAGGRLNRLSLALEYVFCDEIQEMEVIEKNAEVYDLTVPETHNFIGGEIPMILHNTVTQQSLAKWSDADIIVYVGCGERGNEMTEVLTEFPKLTDPKTGDPLLNRTILIANTSNMPVAAREASIYSGMTLAEYYRDMGYNVALMADSTSRWAEAMREISSRLEELPGEEGYPAYLSARLSDFYERAGRSENLNGTQGSISVIGAVSPAGGDFSEPVTQGTLRSVKAFWALDTKLAQRRHFPSINWLTSYSLYPDSLEKWFAENVVADWRAVVDRIMKLLQEEEKLLEVVQLVGSDALPEREQITLQITRLIREVILQQNAFHPVDTYSDLGKTYALMRAILRYGDLAYAALSSGRKLSAILSVKSKDKLGDLKFEKDYEKLIKSITKEIESEFSRLGSK